MSPPFRLGPGGTPNSNWTAPTAIVNQIRAGAGVRILPAPTAPSLLRRRQLITPSATANSNAGATTFLPPHDRR
ncbi:MAG: hypothetical protein IPJ98_12670 [Bryobacterales bacterium]|nr:hypothetical protein [Bryobacterales bacterium]